MARGSTVGADGVGAAGPEEGHDDLVVSIPLASKKTGISERQLRRLVERGELASTKVGGLLRLSRREIDDLASEDDRDGQILEAATGLVRQAHGHVQALIDVATTAARSLLETQAQALRDARERIALLETERDQNRERVERAESQVAERELLAEAHAAQVMREDRSSQAHAKMIEQLGPVLASYALPALAKYAGIEPPPASALTPADVALRAVVSSLRPEQLQAVASSGVLDDAQIAAVARAWQLLHAVPGVVSGDPSGNGSSSAIPAAKADAGQVAGQVAGHEGADRGRTSSAPRNGS